MFDVAGITKIKITNTNYITTFSVPISLYRSMPVYWSRSGLITGATPAKNTANAAGACAML